MKWKDDSPQTIGAMSRLSFMKPASKSGASYGLAEVMWVKPRENGYSRKWNMVKNLPGGICMWSPNHLVESQHAADVIVCFLETYPAITE